MSRKLFGPGIDPLRQPEFRDLWIANFVSNLGSIMHSVAAAWVMTTLTTSPLLIGLVQTAASLPPFLLGLAGGVLADLVDRRRLLVGAQIWMMFSAAILAVMAWNGHLRPWQLLILLFMLGMGSAIHLPGWQTLLQDLVTRDRLAAAVSLNSISFNLARSIAPALGGFLVAAIGAAAVFALNAFSFFAVLAGLRRVPAHLVPKSKGKPTPRAVLRSLGEGWGFLATSPLLRGILLRSGFFVVTGSGVLALLPVVARDHLAGGASVYGLLLSAFGVGSVLGALCIPGLRRRFPLDGVVGVALVIFGTCTVIVAQGRSVALVASAMLFSGVTWIVVAVNHNVSVQVCSPDWVRGRAISFYLLVFQGSLALGSWLAGWIADRAGVGPCITLCGISCAAGVLLIRWFPLTANNPVGERQKTSVATETGI
jgi:MFS family permease